jgi:Mu transposase, C-terminal
LFEAPVHLIDKQVELRFHPEDLSDIEVYFNGKSYGKIIIISPHINAQIGREWKPLDPKPPVITEQPLSTPTGKLFLPEEEL